VLKDVNDMSAEFVTPNTTSVMENIPMGTVVLAIKAIDRDEGRNSYLEYSLAGAGPFSLGPVDGLLRVAGRLDREVQSTYSLEVTAKDRGDPPKESKQMVTVTVLDENDNSPVFDPKQYSASVPENASIGVTVLQVRFLLFLGHGSKTCKSFRIVFLCNPGTNRHGNKYCTCT